MTWFAQQTVQSAINQGIVSHLTSGGFTAEGTLWSSNPMNQEAGPMYVEFNSGWMADIVSIDFGANFIEVTGDLTSMISEGEVFRIRRHTTVDSLLSRTSGAGFVAGFEENSADCLIFGSPQGGYDQSFLLQEENGSHSVWEAGHDLPIYPEQGLILRRQGFGDLTLFEVGELRVRAPIVPVNAGLNLLGTLQSTEPVRLQELGLFTGDPSTGLAAGPDASQADTLLVMDTAGQFREYFHSNFPDPEFQGWRSASYDSADQVEIHPGDAFYLKRKFREGFDWVMPSSVSRL